MLLILIRTIILYLVVLFALRLMGKAELSEMEPFQLVVLFMIAELAAMPMENPGLSLFSGISAIFALMFLQVLISFISYRSEKFRAFFNGRNKVLISKGVINEKALKDMRISISDLLEQLRLKDYPSIADVDYAILETNGELSVIPKTIKKPLTREDLGLLMPDELLPTPLIMNGHLYDSMLPKLQMTETQLKRELLQVGITSYDQVLLCYCDEQKQVVVYKKDEAQNITTNKNPNFKL